MFRQKTLKIWLKKSKQTVLLNNSLLLSKIETNRKKIRRHPKINFSAKAKKGGWVGMTKSFLISHVHLHTCVFIYVGGRLVCGWSLAAPIRERALSKTNGLTDSDLVKI